MLEYPLKSRKKKAATRSSETSLKTGLIDESMTFSYSKT